MRWHQPFHPQYTPSTEYRYTGALSKYALKQLSPEHREAYSQLHKIISQQPIRVLGGEIWASQWDYYAGCYLIEAYDLGGVTIQDDEAFDLDSLGYIIDYLTDELADSLGD
ncbi:hypothetical protein LCGC14_1670330 [marine sediment metagenome]|uniref:Uncharacterized protein n=1 Tax=marine sediment metagenome TaxID=412755 RepID=A0A0F9K7B7_9ZZZZ